QYSVPVASSDFEHDRPQESLRCIRADAHAAGDLFGGVPLHQELESLGFSLRQVESLGGLRDVKMPSISFQQYSQRRSQAIFQTGFQIEYADLVLLLARCIFTGVFL